jgi:hypothetical protein
MTSLEDDEDAGTTSACSEAVARKGTQSVEVPRVTLTKTQPRVSISYATWSSVGSSVSSGPCQHCMIQAVAYNLTDLQPDESHSATHPFVVDQTFILIPYNLSVINCCSTF